jgi:hypothetical protein
LGSRDFKFATFVGISQKMANLKSREQDTELRFKKGIYSKKRWAEYEYYILTVNGVETKKLLSLF